MLLATPELLLPAAELVRVGTDLLPVDMLALTKGVHPLRGARRTLNQRMKLWHQALNVVRIGGGRRVPSLLLHHPGELGLAPNSVLTNLGKG